MRISAVQLRARVREAAAAYARSHSSISDKEYDAINLRITAENDIAKFIERRRVMSVHGKQWAEELKPKIILAS